MINHRIVIMIKMFPNDNNMIICIKVKMNKLAP